jgi:hypothetical protein
MKNWNILGILLITIEMFVVAFALLQAVSGSLLWLLLLIAFFTWLIYSSGLKKSLMTLVMTAILAISFVIGGIFLALIVYVAMIVMGEFFINSRSNDE